MCHAHPHYHGCQHTSVKWFYCPEGAFDPKVGYASPCSNPIYTAPQPSNADCPLQNCNYKVLGGSWTCCQCAYNANSQGWCNGKDSRLGKTYIVSSSGNTEWQSCGHGCCSKCVANNSSSSSPELASTDVRKGKHRSRRGAQS
ncbi:hypothetical protein BKA67DRAFT_606964 [Truncatella angustata]|uniref:Uncharacterized protein n=1 Tax=Truncatella angustata TaxID=152316 RepID=A0A9P8UJC1_9PEZI|nr:uncharacterized protein BKA67DRAFT_606964 [Truncatella angustata]KAH6653498.1 hypothetical protein BKA67DRAFT_606964 [Truncatella angustata]